MKYQAIINQHSSQEYGILNSGLVIDHLLYRYPLFSNEALYIVDCKYVQLEPLSSNFSEIIGIDTPHKNDLTLLYEHISDRNRNAVVGWVETVLQGVFRESAGFEVEKDVFKCIYLTQKNKVLLKCTTTLAYDSKGTMRYSLGKLTDLTDLVPFQHFTYKFAGPSQERMYERYGLQTLGKNILSRRETEIIKHIGQGQTSQEIAGKLFISRLTVDKHRRNIIEKLDCKSATEAYVKYRDLGLG